MPVQDLHDFVAHDVSGIVAQAQAARFVASGRPEAAGAALERIEAVGLAALATMDHMVGMLHEPDGPAVRPVPTLVDLPGLVDPFRAGGDADVRFTEVPRPVRAPRDTGAVAYRVVVEALTNVRRHTASARRVDVLVTGGPAGVEVRIRDDGPGATPWRRPPGAGGRMPGIDGLELTRLLTEAGLRAVVVTTFDHDAYVDGALRNGACGFLLKRSGPALLVEGVRAAVAGDALISPEVTVRLLRAVTTAARPEAPNPLTNRETDIVRLVARGLTNAQIGAELFISPGTAKTHIANIQAKLGLHNRVAVAAWAWRAGLADPWRPSWSRCARLAIEAVVAAHASRRVRGHRRYRAGGRPRHRWRVRPPRIAVMAAHPA
ncbi:helix-turn-helix transcriptional regulator [Actinoplanes campanulatus]|uniref:helix-turn-helix transcriptional regulator n=1 Tax=Actinoplanes campanulatus TaxID=113559 RepID=UPI001954610E|nr:response regulator transcription factor family protein [Actinoplanes capillaceus]